MGSAGTTARLGIRTSGDRPEAAADRAIATIGNTRGTRRNDETSKEFSTIWIFICSGSKDLVFGFAHN
jgi:hypothetical protein